MTIFLGHPHPTKILNCHPEQLNCLRQLERGMTPAIATDARPGGPTAKRQPSPEGLGHRIPQHCPPAPACRGSAVGAAHFHLNLHQYSVEKTFPARACRTADPSASLGMTKVKVDASMCIRWLMGRNAGPHSTSLRAGSPLRFAPVGMTNHILVGCGAQENLPRIASSANFRYPSGTSSNLRSIYGASSQSQRP
jgi:hypothetical protein